MGNTSQDGGISDEFITVDGQEYLLTYHVSEQVLTRNIERVWLESVLADWVARRFETAHNSMNYYGIIPGRRRLFMVCVSANRPAITTAYFNSAATVQYNQGWYGYFDEVRNVSDSQVR